MTKKFPSPKKIMKTKKHLQFKPKEEQQRYKTEIPAKRFTINL